MQFCPIAPVQALRIVKGKSTVHMALAQYLDVREYREYFQERLSDGDTVIMDNGAYEGATMQDEQLVDLMEMLKPSVTVIPDEPGSFHLSERKCVQFRSLLYKKSIKANLMKVIHAESGKLHEFLSAYIIASTTCSWVGFSRLTSKYSSLWPHAIGRIKFAQELKMRGYWKQQVKHHALGMLNGDTDELPLLDKAGFHSCDSSAPIWRGIHGYDITDKSWPNYAFEPVAAPEAKDWVTAAGNLERVLKACQGQDPGDDQKWKSTSVRA